MTEKPLPDSVKRNMSMLLNVISLESGVHGVVSLCEITGLKQRASQIAAKHLMAQGKIHRVVGKNRNQSLYFLGRDPSIPRPSEEGRLRFRPSGIFTVVKWNPEDNRPGCTEFLKYPSRRADTLVPHRAPMHAMVGNLADRRNLAKD
jgi:hypothetical protein